MCSLSIDRILEILKMLLLSRVTVCLNCLTLVHDCSKRIGFLCDILVASQGMKVLEYEL